MRPGPCQLKPSCDIEKPMGNVKSSLVPLTKRGGGGDRIETWATRTLHEVQREEQNRRAGMLWLRSDDEDYAWYIREYLIVHDEKEGRGRQ